MRIGRWTLEVLVNEIPLREYVISDSVLGASASNVLKSYVFEGNRKKFCDSATFIAVPGPGTYYSIVVSPSTSKIAPKIYVDGRNDDSYVKKWIETDIPQRTKYGGLGVKIPETKKYFDVALTTKFSEGIECYGDRSSYKIVRDDEPLAVLHINYRLADWLIPIVANTPTVYTQNSCASSSTSTSSTSSPSTSTTSTSYQEMIVSSAATNVDIKNEVNNFESDTENKPLITQSIKKRKRRYQEIIVILDSDEECTHEAVELD
ncbi:unnamed protein product [Rhizophagus irregularis]|nr:unnamed protein product [Rhizophagus irregularis]CAB5376314.1 unnamed protein product [Rhizophagus irregularis]